MKFDAILFQTAMTKMIKMIVLIVCNNMYEVNVEHSHFRLIHFALCTCLEYLILIPISENSGFYHFTHFFIILNLNSVNVTLVFTYLFKSDILYGDFYYLLLILDC